MFGKNTTKNVLLIKWRNILQIKLRHMLLLYYTYSVETLGFYNFFFFKYKKNKNYLFAIFVTNFPTLRYLFVSFFQLFRKFTYH